LIRTCRWVAAALLALAYGSSALAFGFKDVVDRAQQLAAQPHVPPVEIPRFMREIGYDQHRGIRYQSRHHLWRSADSMFQVAPLMPGGVYKHAVPINEVVGATVRRVPYQKHHFSFDEEELQQRIPDDVGYAGFELLYAFDRNAGSAKFMVFAGASYFRAIGKGGQWGLSVRGAAIDTGLPSGEEFPDFIEFWLVRPRPRATRMTVYALLDSPRLTGGQSAHVPESLQRLWWDSGQSGQEGRTVRDRSRELAEALVGWRTVRPRWADGPPLYFKFVPERVSNWCGLQSRTADSPAMVRGRSAG